MTLDITGRNDFNETWLAEMPQGLGSFDTFDTIDYTIKDRIRHGSEVIDVTNDIKKIVGSQTMFYWYQSGDQIVLATEMLIKAQGLVVTVTGKNPKWRGKPPYASELYDAILDDNNRSLRLFSDESLSDEGYAIWKRMLASGHSVSVYDKENPGKSFVTFNNASEMDEYFADDDTDFKRYQYVLSERNDMLAETRTLFLLRRHREFIDRLL
jgi:hypothetical protein